MQPAIHPKYQIEMRKVALLRDTVNLCIEYPLEGSKLADDAPKLKALDAYLLVQYAGLKVESGKH